MNNHDVYGQRTVHQPPVSVCVCVCLEAIR